MGGPLSDGVRVETSSWDKVRRLSGDSFKPKLRCFFFGGGDLRHLLSRTLNYIEMHLSSPACPSFVSANHGQCPHSCCQEHRYRRPRVAISSPPLAPPHLDSSTIP
ncbi:hypothetical protein VTI74DRAFT_8731 [Chaetomium olivicolor]